jgi:hypothetical protein
MSDNLKMYQVEYVAMVTGNVQVEAVSHHDAEVKARSRLTLEGFPHEPESVHQIDGIAVGEIEEEG